MTELEQAARQALEALESAPVQYDFNSYPMLVMTPDTLQTTLTALREALDHIAATGKLIPQFIPVGIVNDHHSITWMEEIVDDQAPIGAILYALQDSVGRNVSFVDESVCNWRQPTYDDAECNAWQADCDQYWAITEGTPTENGMKFCHGCGKPIKEHPFVDSEDEQ